MVMLSKHPPAPPQGGNDLLFQYVTRNLDSQDKQIETFEKLTFKSLRGAERRGPATAGLRFARNDNIGVLQRSRRSSQTLERYYYDKCKPAL